MGKDYKGITGEVFSAVTDKKTIFVTPKLFKAPINLYQKMIDDSSKIAINIQDRTNGKGDNSFVVYYNLDLRDWGYIRLKGRHAIVEEKDFSTYLQKIYGNTLVQSGQFAGLSNAIHFSIERGQVGPDGTPMRYPWRISIDNGYAQRKPGSHEGTFSEMPKTYRSEKKSMFNLNDKDMLKMIDDVDLTILVTAVVFAERYLEKGRTEFERSKAKTQQPAQYQQAQPTQYQQAQPAQYQQAQPAQYQQAQPTQYQQAQPAQYQQAQPTQYQQAQPAQYQQAQPSQYQQAQQAQPTQYQKATVYEVIPSKADLMTDANGTKLLCNFKVDGLDRYVYFPKGVPVDVEKARKTGYALSIPIRVEGNRCVYAS